MTDPLMLAPETVARLLDARGRYATEVSPHYDEVLDEVARRIATTGSIGKLDIGAVLFWKRLRADTPWVRELIPRGFAS